MKVIKITVEMTEDEYEEFKDAKEGFLNLNISVHGVPHSIP